MRPRSGLAVLAACAALATRAPAQGRAPCPPGEVAALEGRLQALVDSLVRTTPALPGAAVTVLAPGRCLAWSGAAGVAHRGTREAMVPGRPVRIASNTKTYTAAAILRLWEQGRLSLDDAMARHVPAAELASLRAAGYAIDAITVRQLLAHTAGLYDYAMDARFLAAITREPSHRWTRQEQVDSAAAWGKPYGAPGAVFHYTDTGYILLGRILERLSGLPLADAYRQLLGFDRLGLRATWLETLEPRPLGLPDLAHQYMDTLDARTLDPSFDLYGGGGLAATTGDMARFTRALFTGGVFARAATADTMRAFPSPVSAASAYALGLRRADVDGATGWGHTGFWNTVSLHFPAPDVTVAGAFTEQTLRPVREAVVREVLRALAR